MGDKEKLNFFEQNIHQIFSHKSNHLVGFITECTDVNGLNKAFSYWPDHIKIKIVTNYLEELKTQNLINEI